MEKKVPNSCYSWADDDLNLFFFVFDYSEFQQRTQPEDFDASKLHAKL